MDDLYRDYILEHSRHPHNFGVLEQPTASHEGANPLCGDRITMQLGIRDGKVAEVAFTGRGCAISQASAESADRRGQGDDRRRRRSAYRADDLLELLGIDISPARLKCAMLSLETLEAALDDARAGTSAAPAPVSAESSAG